MKKFALFLFVAAVLAGCGEDDKVVIKGSFGEAKEGIVYLDQSDVDRSTVIDSATIKRNRFKFSTSVTGPEFLQVRLNNNDFIGLLASPGEEINLDFGSSPLVMNYTVSGSAGSDLIRGLDQYLFTTKVKLDSLTKIYTGLSDDEIAVQGAGLEKAYVDAVEAQRKHNIEFILGNITSLASIKGTVPEDR